MQDGKKIDYLTEDTPISGQKFCCFSIITPESVKSDVKFDVRAFKFRGAYDTYDEAMARAKYLQNIDKQFNIYVGEAGKWLPLTDDPSKAKEETYAEEQLNKLMKAHYENQEKAKQEHERRTNELTSKMINEANHKKLKKQKKKAKKNPQNELAKAADEPVIDPKEEELNMEEKKLITERDQLKEVKKSLDVEHNKLIDETNIYTAMDLEEKKLKEEYEKLCKNK